MNHIFAYVGNNLYKRYDNRTFSNANNISKTIGRYTTDAVHSYKLNKVSNLRNTYYNCIDDVVVNKHNAMYANDNRKETKINKLANFNYSHYFTEKI